MNALVSLSSPLRGGTVLPAADWHVSAVTFTRGWGSQPATALVDWATELPQDPPPPGATVRIAVGGHVFWGVLIQPEHVLGTSGFSMAHTIEDCRHFLDLDVVYGVFNRQDHQVVEGQLVRRFKHLLPADIPSGVWSYTDTPYSAAEVLALLLGSDWVETDWGYAWLDAQGVETPGAWHPLLRNFPVFDVDYSGGQKLGAALVELSSRVGLTFTITGNVITNTVADGLRLCWCLRGDGGVLPTFALPGGGTSVFPSTSTDRRLGTQYAGNPSRLSVVGDQNLYQVLNVRLEPDWLTAWEPLWNPLALTEDIFLHESDEAGRAYCSHSYYVPDGDAMPGWLAAGARAARITVAEYAQRREVRHAGDGARYRDTRRYGGRSRMNLPAALYIQALVYRAYRVASGQSLVNAYGRTVELRALRIASAALQDVTYSPVTGVMTPGITYQANGNGLAIAQGIKLIAEDMQLFRPEYFDTTAFTALNSRWSEASFQVDESGEGYQFLIFDERLVQTTGLFATRPGPGRDFVVPVADAVPLAAPVRAALVFAGERFCYTAGTGERDGVESAPGLAAEFVVAAPGGTAVEIAYADGQTAQAKAAAIAAAWLGRQIWYVSGGYRQQYPVVATALHPMHNRVTVVFNTEEGLTETVDFTAERPHQADAAGNVIIEPPRIYDRRTVEFGQVAGLREQRQAADQLRTQAALLGGLKGAALRKEAQQTWQMMRGYGEAKTVLLKG